MLDGRASFDELELDAAIFLPAVLRGIASDGLLACVASGFDAIAGDPLRYAPGCHGSSSWTPGRPLAVGTLRAGTKL